MQFDVIFSATDQRFDAVFASVQPATSIQELDPYAGAYTVTPKVTAQTLPTAQKRVTQDMAVKSIPCCAGSCPRRGETVYIGSEVDIYGD